MLVWGSCKCQHNPQLIFCFYMNFMFVLYSNQLNFTMCLMLTFFTALSKTKNRFIKTLIIYTYNSENEQKTMLLTSDLTDNGGCLVLFENHTYCMFFLWNDKRISCEENYQPNGCFSYLDTRCSHAQQSCTICLLNTSTLTEC